MKDFVRACVKENVQRVKIYSFVHFSVASITYRLDNSSCSVDIFCICCLYRFSTSLSVVNFPGDGGSPKKIIFSFVFEWLFILLILKGTFSTNQDTF